MNVREGDGASIATKRFVDTTIELRTRFDDDHRARTFTRFPIRFGRDEGCDLQLPHSFVSRHHGRIEERDGRLVLLDDGSRNGIEYEGKKLLPGVPVPLSGDAGEFRIERLVVSFQLHEVTQPLSPPPLPSQQTSLPSNDGSDTASSPQATTGSFHVAAAGVAVVASTIIPAFPTDGLRNETSLYGAGHVPRLLDQTSQARSALDEYRAARAVAIDDVRRAVEGVAGSARTEMVRELVTDYAELMHDPDLRDLAERSDVALPPLPLAPEARAALRGLQTLAAYHVGESVVPESDEEVAEFVRAIHRALDVVDDFVVHEAEVTSPTARDRALSHPGWYLRARLLDWRQPATERERALQECALGIRDRCADRVAAVQFADALIEELAPAAIEAATPKHWWHGARPVRQLWSTYVTVHARLALKWREQIRPIVENSPPNAPLARRTVVPSPVVNDEKSPHWPFACEPAWE